VVEGGEGQLHTLASLPTRIASSTRARRRLEQL